MPLRVCPNVGPYCPDDPIGNYSSEASDLIDYVSNAFAGEPQPLLHNWSSTECGFTYISTISQLDADLHARAGAEMCNCNACAFLNTSQTCCVPCPDGSLSCYTVPGGLFPGLNQASADALAHSVACSLVNKNLLCLGPINPCTCAGSAYLTTLTSTLPASWSLTGGSLPPGLKFSVASSTSAVISGTSLIPGLFSFQITATTMDGVSTNKIYAISVIKITTTSITPFVVGVPYSFQMQATGGSGSYNWEISSGTLPDGLSMSLSGLITGTPIDSNPGTATFVVVDTACEILHPPKVVLQTSATTTIATIRGFPEYQGFVSTPPKKYKILTWTGESDHQVYNIPENPPSFPNGQLVASAKYTYSGQSQIDTHGNFISFYTKDLTALCNSSTIPSVGQIGNTATPFAGPLYGWCNPPDGEAGVGCVTCPTSLIDFGNYSNNNVNDFSNLAAVVVSGGMFVPGPTATVINATQAQGTGPGTVTFLSTQLVPLAGRGFPNWIGSDFTQFRLNWNHNYSSQLSVEYTDAEAMQNAQVITSSGATAQNLPRTTGFISTFTTVNFSLVCSNLIPGEPYIVTVQLQDVATGNITTNTYPITPVSSSFTITDTIPTPAAGSQTTVRRAQIAFAV